MAKAKSGKSQSEMEAAIVGSATHHFAERGFYSPTLREITSDAGVSLPVIYWFFTDKRHLYIECCIRAVKEDLESLSEAVALLSDPAEIIFAFASRHCEYHSRDGSKLLHQVLLYNDEEILARIAPFLSAADAFRKARLAIEKLGNPREAEKTLFLLISVFSGIIEHGRAWAFQPGYPKKSDLRTEKIVVQGLRMLIPGTDWRTVAKKLAPRSSVEKASVEEESN